MSAFDKRLQKTALRLLKKYGQTLTLTHVASGAYNVSTGGITNTEISEQVKGLVDDFDVRAYGNTANLLLRDSDKKITIAALGLASAPKVGDKITANGIVYSVVPVANGGLGVVAFGAAEDCYYEIHGRCT